MKLSEKHKENLDVSTKPFLGKLIGSRCMGNYMSLYTSEYKSDHVTKDKPIRWIWLKQSVNRKNAIIQNIIILKYKYTENYRKYNKRKKNTETSME